MRSAMIGSMSPSMRYTSEAVAGRPGIPTGTLSFCAGPEARWVRISRSLAHTRTTCDGYTPCATALSSTHAARPRSANSARVISSSHIGPRYNGWLHFATTSVGSLAAIAFAVSRVHAPIAARARGRPGLLPDREPRRVLRPPWPDAPPSQSAPSRSCSSATRNSTTATTRTRRWPPTRRATSRWSCSRR